MRLRKGMRLLYLEEDGTVSLTEDKDRMPYDYAILSHTWGCDDEEVIFDDLQHLASPDKREAIVAKPGYRKLLFCAQQTQRCGLRYFWIDTCCINRSSSAELQEAINSMFEWYRAAPRAISKSCPRERAASRKGPRFHTGQYFQARPGTLLAAKYAGGLQAHVGGHLGKTEGSRPPAPGNDACRLFVRKH